jgi:tRNA A58 N-methylase Trm61
LSVTQDTLALLALQPLIPGFFPFSSSALRPAAMLLLVNDLVANRRKSAIEFGAGASTIVLGSAMRQFGGQLISVEHDLDWLEVVRSLINKYGLTDRVTLVHAPLEPLKRPAPLEQSHSWYAHTPILEALGSNQVDFAIVDVPPAY